MPYRFAVAVLAMVLPLSFAGSAQAAPHAGPGRVITATYRWDKPRLSFLQLNRSPVSRPPRDKRPRG